MCDHDTVEVEATPQTIRNNDGIIKRAISSTTGHLRNRGAKLESPPISLLLFLLCTQQACQL